jgi:cytochrome c oxidase subunit 2
MSILLTPAMANSGKQFTFWERFTPPQDISENGHLIDWLFNYTTSLNVFFFFLVCLGLFGFSFLYHRKRHPKPYYTYGNKKMHITVATVIGVAVFLGVDLNISRISNNDFMNVFAKWPGEDEDIVRVEVLAQQWMWNYRYAGRDGIFNTDDDVVTVNDLRVPTGKKIVFQIISKDVIHSHFLPNTRRKVDAIPGRLTRMWVKLKTPGVYDVACAEMCGTFHYRMQAKMTVYTPEDYQAWLEEAQRIALETNDPEVADNYWGWKWNK